MKKKFVWLVLSFLLVASLVLASCGGGEPETSKRRGFVPGATKGEEVSGGKDVETVYLNIGETYESTAVKVIVSNPVWIKSYEYYDASTGSTAVKEAKEGENFLIVDVEMENVGDTIRRDEGGDRFRVFDADNRAIRSGYYFVDEERLTVEHQFQPGMVLEGKVLFNIPEERTGITIAYITGLIPVEKVAVWALE